jgi:hypothetical protein
VGVATEASLSSPFKGLRSFEERDTDFFFGRAAERRICAANLRANRMTVLYAPSGVGKTSLLAAGVLPDMKRSAARLEPGKPPRYWPILCREWTGDPLAYLECSVDKAFLAFDGADTLAKSGSFEEKLAARTKWMGGPVFLILDQFERLYLGELPPDTVQRFVEFLGRIVTESELPVNVLLAVREDCLAVLDHVGEYVPSAKRNWLSLGELTKEGATEAVCEPIRWWNKQQHPQDAVVVDYETFAASAMDACRSSRHSRFRPSSEPRYDAPLLQLLMKNRWEEGWPGRKLEPIENASMILELEQYVGARLDGFKGSERYAVAAIFSHLISPSGRPLPLSRDELEKKGPDPALKHTVPPDAIASVLCKLADDSGDGPLLQEIPGGVDRVDPLYTILQDFLVKPIQSWRTRVAELESRFAEYDQTIETKAWPKRLLTALVLILVILAIAIPTAILVAQPKYKSLEAALGVADRIVLDNSVFLAEGRSDPKAGKLLSAPDGVLLWAATGIDPILIKRPLGQGLYPAGLERPEAQVNYYRGRFSPHWRLPFSAGGAANDIRYVGMSDEGNWQICRLRDDADGAYCSPDNIPSLSSTANFIGFSAGAGELFALSSSGVGVLFDPGQSFSSQKTLKFPPTPAINAASVTDDGRLLAVLDRGVIRVYNAEKGHEDSHFRPGTQINAIAFLPDLPPATIAQWLLFHFDPLIPHRAVRLAISSDRGIQTCSLSGRCVAYPDDNQRLIQGLWKSSRLIR